jgi:hypothetical protein
MAPPWKWREFKDDGFAFEMKALADWYGMDLCRIAVDECLNQ